jgi:hypothetical protein
MGVSYQTKMVDQKCPLGPIAIIYVCFDMLMGKGGTNETGRKLQQL